MEKLDKSDCSWHTLQGQGYERSTYHLFPGAYVRKYLSVLHVETRSLWQEFLYQKSDRSSLNSPLWGFWTSSDKRKVKKKEKTFSHWFIADTLEKEIGVFIIIVAVGSMGSERREISAAIIAVPIFLETFSLHGLETWQKSHYRW